MAAKENGGVVISPTTARKKGRVFLLHGFAQNAVAFKYKTRNLTKKLNQAGYDCIFLEAPHVLPPKSAVVVDGVPVEVDNWGRDNARAWFFYSIDDPGDTSMALTKRPLHYVGLDESVRLVQRQIVESSSADADSPFCALLGFSQGAVLGHVLAGIASDSDVSFALPIRAAIFCSGFEAQHVCNDEKTNSISLGRLGQKFSSFRHDAPSLLISLPSLHVIGRKDTHVEPSLSLDLANRFRDHQTLYHDKGHVIPQASADCAAMIAFLDQQWKQQQTEKPESKYKRL